jgi:hypothetical protein
MTIRTSQVISRADGSLTVARKLRSKVAMLVAACVIIFILTVGTPLIIHNGDKDSSGLPNLYRGLIITAYAADGASVMSSVPGFPITLTCEDSDNLSLQTSEGIRHNDLLDSFG